ncbi:SMI1/KNR4 family protein [Hymenobacter sp.]|jgi:hypothetical protein|uniref:SMI1/KNR4 family protein n=1 Tax=Hymenobacter sp. TaxID=1898978 RepID=UPI002ED88DAA
MEQLLHLKIIWERAKIRSEWTASESDILKFETDHNVKLPEDFRSYFETVNGMDGEVDSGFYEFYSLNKVEDVVTQLGDYHGIPKHSDILHEIEYPEMCFVFADYSISVIVYAIRLGNVNTTKNEVYAICGGIHEVIAESFSDFISLYLENPDALLI